MRADVAALARCWLEAFPPAGRVLEVGAYQTPGQDPQWALRSLLGPARHLGVDLRSGAGVDLIADGARLPFGAARIAALAALDVLEHAPRPAALLAELARVLAPGGAVLVVTVLDFAIHAAPRDYWRFTPDGLLLLADGFPQAAVGQLGVDDFPHTVWLVLGRDVGDFAARVERLRTAYERAQPRLPWAWRLPLPWLRWAGLSRFRRRILAHRHVRLRVARA